MPFAEMSSWRRCRDAGVAFHDTAADHPKLECDLSRSKAATASGSTNSSLTCSCTCGGELIKNPLHPLRQRGVSAPWRQGVSFPCRSMSPDSYTRVTGRRAMEIARAREPPLGQRGYPKVDLA